MTGKDSRLQTSAVTSNTTRDNARPQRGQRTDRLFRQRIAVILAFSTVILALVLDTIFSYFSVNQLNADARQVAHTLEVIDVIHAARDELATFTRGVDDSQSVTQEQALVQFETSQRRLTDLLRELSGLTSDNPVQQERLPEIRDAVKEFFAAMVSAAENGLQEPMPWSAFVRLDSNQRGLRQRVLAGLQQMEQEERGLLGIREAQNAQTYSWALIRILLTGVGGLVLIGTFVELVRQHLTAREAVTSELQEQRELLHATLAGIGDGVIATDPQGLVTFMNPVAEQLTGWTEADSIGRALDEVCIIENESTRARVENPALRAMAENRIQGLANHSVLIARNSVIRPIDDSAAPIRNVKGHVTGSVLIFRDISERRQRERELADREQQIRLLLDSTAEAIFGVDLQGRCTFCNASCLKLLGYDQLSEVLGKELSGLISQHRADGREILAAESRLQQLLRDGQPVCADDETFGRSDGSRFPVEYRGFPILHEGTLQGAVFSFTDITSRRSGEQAQAERSRLVALRAAKSASMARDASLSEALQDLMAALVECVQVNMARIWMLDETGKMLQLMAHCHAGCSSHESIRQVAVGQYLVGAVAAMQRPLILDDIQNDPRVADPEWVRREGLNSFAGYPLIVDHRLAGVLVLLSRQPLTASVLTELSPLADGIAQFMERKRAEQRARESEERIRLAMEAADIGTWDYDVRTDRVDWSARCKAIFGVPAHAEPTYDDFVNRLHVDDRARVEDLIQQSLQGVGDGDYQSDFRVVWPDQSLHWVAARGQTYFDDVDGIRTAVRFVGTVLDISHRVQSMEAIRLRSDQLQRLSDVARQLTSANDVQSILRVVTDGARRVIGARRAITRYCRDGIETQLLTSPVEVTTDDLTARLHVDRVTLDGTAGNRDRILAMTHEVLATHDDWQSTAEEDRNLKGRLLASLVKLDGSIVGDIQVSDHEDHEFTADDEAVLVQLAQMASLAVEKARLYEQAQASDRRKDDFLAMLGHELRNPLSGIVSGVDALGMLSLNDEAREFRDIIGRQSAHMARIVDDLLDVSRIMRGKLTLKPEAIDLTKLIEQVVRDYRRSQLVEACEIVLAMPDSPTWIMGDSTRLVQILSNVIHNGCKFCDGPNTVSVSLTHDLSNAQAEIRVSDRGIGMDAATLLHMFEPFNQADTSVERSRGGLGIGLALVRGLVKLHGGEIAAQSEGLGQGSTFVLHFPTIDPPQTPIVQQAEVAARPCRVLLIDDRRDAIAPLEKMLRLDGHEVMTANDGPMGVARAREFRPDVVLCDIGLAGNMNGYEVVGALRSMSDLNEAYFVAVTGYGQDEDRVRARAAGFDYHVTKPVSKERLRQLLAERPRFA